MGEKTEEATPHRRQKAKDDGDQPFSADAVRLGVAAGGVLLTHTVVGPLLLQQFESVLMGSLAVVAAGEGVSDLLEAWLHWLLLLAFGVFCVVFVSCVSGAAVQGGLHFSAAKLKVKWDALDPVAGAKKLFSVQKLMELLMGLAKLTLVTLLVVFIMERFLRQTRGAPGAPVTSFWDLLLVLQVGCLAIFVPFAVVDVVMQRILFSRRIRMSFEDIKEESKNLEGNPEVKSERRRLMHESAEEAPASAARGASFVAANPTHIAVAIRYDAELDGVPVVLVRGAGDKALRIFAEARAAGVPIIEHKVLARKLFKRTGPNQMVPADLLEIVAQILVYLSRSRKVLP